jgi:hypothetical protein
MLKLLWPISGGSTGARLMFNYLYKSEVLEKVLQDYFGSNESLFGKPALRRPATNKVAVVASGESGERSVLLTNYNREWQLNDDESKKSPVNPLTPFSCVQTTSCEERKDRRTSSRSGKCE